jgi:ABC-type sugar transport system ATPase subunit
MLTKVDVRGGGQEVAASTLSSGNQQKLRSPGRAARSAGADRDEPTRGVDVGAKRAIYELLASLTESRLGC